MGTKLVKFFNLEKIKKFAKLRGEKWKEKVRRQKNDFFPHSPPHISCLLCVGDFFLRIAMANIFIFSPTSHTRSNIEFNYFISSSFHLLIKFLFPSLTSWEWEKKNHKRIFCLLSCIPNDICLSMKKNFQEIHKEKKLFSLKNFLMIEIVLHLRN
jgi:hypothetical protein